MNVLVMCSRGYGHTFSAINAKSEYIALGLLDAGCEVRIINNVRGEASATHVEEHISDAGVRYVDFPMARHHSIWPNIKRFRKLLLRYKRDNVPNHLIISVDYMPIFICLTRSAKVAGYSVSSLYQEWPVGMKSKGLFHWINKYWVAKRFGRYVDMIFPISHFLQEKCERFNKPNMILPVLGLYKDMIAQQIKPQFSYCADACYLMRNQIILRAYKMIAKKYQQTQLNLILFGSQTDMQSVQSILYKMNLDKQVVIRSQIASAELEAIYKSSLGLLIPLNPASQLDVARFSQKIAEYLATGRPIITSDVGEIPYYFKNRENAMVVDYTPAAYADAMSELVDNPDWASRIGKCGYDVGRKYFDCRKNGKRIIAFWENI